MAGPFTGGAPALLAGGSAGGFAGGFAGGAPASLAGGAGGSAGGFAGGLAGGSAGALIEEPKTLSAETNFGSTWGSIFPGTVTTGANAAP